MGCFSSADVKRLLHNKYVAVLGDSIQRSVYKDLVSLLQNDSFLTQAQLRNKGEMTFDTLVEGGSLCEMHNGVTYREVRQYRTGHHLMRFYFLTWAYSTYMESVLADFKEGPKPDVIIISSCIWDLIRYTHKPVEVYKKNLDCLFFRLNDVLSPKCLVIWNMTMPVGFKASEMPQYTKHNLRWDIVERNFYSATLANFHKMDVLDMHYHFRFDLRSRCKDAIHWNHLAHRKYSQILLAHIAQAWGVEPPERTKIISYAIPNGPLPVVPFGNVPHPHPKYNDQENGQHYFGPPIQNDPPHGVLLRNVPHPHPPCSQGNVQPCFEPMYIPGYTAFDGTDNSNMIGPFIPGPGIRFHPNQRNSNAVSPFVDDDSQFFVNFPPGNVGFDGFGRITNVNFTVPMFQNTPFRSMTINSYHLSVPGEFGTFHYNSPVPRGAWRGHHRMHRRREGKPMKPYHRPPSYSSRI
ncbi:PC-esterase domain-containing protein 1A-like [Aquarana catesbeiana]|uniref:PC-esterase domain-containing protein 1A-like n=1 Tax=Aquarana catesbeiana TaxID=8400 RepID=UPI003CCA6A29